MKNLILITVALLISQISLAKANKALERLNKTGIIQHFVAPCQLAKSDTHVELEIIRLFEEGFDLTSKISMSRASTAEVKYDVGSCFYLFINKMDLRD